MNSLNQLSYSWMLVLDSHLQVYFMHDSLNSIPAAFLD